VRKSSKNKRDDYSFYKAQKRLKNWQKRADKGELDLYYFDEAGFNLTPSVPYAWQKRNERIEVPSLKSQNNTVLGFMNKDQDFHGYIRPGSVNSDDVIYCFDDFCEKIRKGKSSKHKTIVMVDNAPTHTSRKFKLKIREWEKLGLRIKFLPTYSPELNLIEILWKFIKYKWIPFKAYSSKESLFNELNFILYNVGTKYRINFN